MSFRPTLQPLEERVLLAIITDLGPEGGNGNIDNVYGINNAGQVVGDLTTTGGALDPFLYSGGRVIDLGTLGGSVGSAHGINNAGQVVGGSSTASDDFHAFLYSGGRMIDLGTLGGSGGSSALGINNAGQVVGDSFLPGNSAYHAFLYDGTAKPPMKDLGTLGGDSKAFGINDTGQVVGYSRTASGAIHPFLYSGGRMTDLGTLGGSGGEAWGINNAGQVVGYSSTANGDDHAFLYDVTATPPMKDLGSGYASGINNAGEVVGDSETGGYPFLYSGGRIIDLNSLLPANSGWNLDSAFAINDTGQIVGDGIYNGQEHVFLLNRASGLVPSQMTHAYGLDRVAFEDATHARVAGNGAGQTIGIVDAYDDPNIASDLAFFDSYYGLPAPPSFSKVNQTGGTTYPPPDTAWARETALDVEWAHVMAPAANILLIEANSSGDLYTAVDYAGSHANVVSMSWSSGEFSGETGFDNHFTHAGTVYFGSTGDDGAPGGYPAFSRNVVAVGGTSLYLDDTSNYSSESGWSGSGGGISRYEDQPSYQSGVVTQSMTRRCAPDLAMDADPNTGALVYNTYQSGGWTVLGGTSLAAPLTAGVAAVVNQGRSYLLGRPSYNGLDFLNALYHLPQSDLNDITTGNNGFAAGPGYDLVTGRGTPIVDRFVSGLIGAPVYNPLTGALLVTGGGRGGNDTVTLNQTASQLVVQVSTDTPVAGSGIPASQTFTFYNSQVSSVTVATSDGSTTVVLQDTPTIPVTLLGTAGTNTVRAPNTANTWQITGTNAGTLNGTVSFSGFQNLAGGSANDAFNFGNGASLSGTVSGGGGTDTLNLADFTADLTVNVTGANAGNVPSVVGAFANVQNVTTGAGNDTFVFGNGASLSGTVNGGGGSNTLDYSACTTNVVVNLQTNFVNFQNLLGGSGSNTLVGPNANTTWNVTAQNAGDLNGAISFSGFQNLVGGSGADTFVVSDGAGVDGRIDGGGGANTLDESAYTTSVAVDLTALTATGVGGTVANLQNFVGGSGSNTLNGPAAVTTWGLSGSNAGTLSGGFSFTAFGTLTGSVGDNTFVFANGASVSGSITGGGGTNSLNYAAYTGNVIVNLQLNTATGVGGSVTNIQNVTGGNGAGGYNILVGNGGNVLTGGNGRRNLLIAGAAASTLVGGDGEDILIAGTTDYDTDTAALLDIMGVWASADTYANRVNRLTNDASYAFPLNARTVHSNGGGNALIGKPVGSALDLYFANLGGGDTTDATDSDTMIGIA